MKSPPVTEDFFLAIKDTDLRQNQPTLLPLDLFRKMHDNRQCKEQANAAQ
jgi:hypothetical protein